MDKKIVYCRNRQVYLAYDAGLPVDLNHIRHDGYMYKSRQESNMPSNDMAIILRNVGYDVCVGTGGVVVVKVNNETIRGYNLSSFVENIDAAIDFCLVSYISNYRHSINSDVLERAVSESYFTNAHRYELSPTEKNSMFENGMHCGYNEGFICGFGAAVSTYTTSTRRNYVFCPSDDKDVFNNGKYLGFIEGYQFGYEYGVNEKHRIKGSVSCEIGDLIGGISSRRKYWL